MATRLTKGLSNWPMRIIATSGRSAYQHHPCFAPEMGEALHEQMDRRAHWRQCCFRHKGGVKIAPEQVHGRRPEAPENPRLAAPDGDGARRPDPYAAWRDLGSALPDLGLRLRKPGEP